MEGIRIENQPLGSPFAGFFGLLIQKATNFALFARDTQGGRVYGVTVELSYTINSVLTREIIKYDPLVLYERAYPTDGSISYKIYGQGIAPQTGVINILPGQFITFTAVLQPGYVQARRYYK